MLNNRWVWQNLSRKTSWNGIEFPAWTRRLARSLPTLLFCYDYFWPYSFIFVLNLVRKYSLCRKTGLNCIPTFESFPTSTLLVIVFAFKADLIPAYVVKCDEYRIFFLSQVFSHLLFLRVIFSGHLFCEQIIMMWMANQVFKVPFKVEQAMWWCAIMGLCQTEVRKRCLHLLVWYGIKEFWMHKGILSFEVHWFFLFLLR